MLKRLAAVAALLCAASLTITSCGSSSATRTSAPTGQPAASAGPTAPAAPTATRELVSSGEFKIALSEMGSFDLLMKDGTSASYLDALYDYAIGATNAGKVNSQSGWASTWSMNPEGTAWTVKGREGLTFHNGDRVTARDVKANIERMMADGFAGSGGVALRAQVASMQAPDDNTFGVSLKATNIFWPVQALSRVAGGAGSSYLVPGAYVASKGEAAANKSPVGSGPYRFVSVAVSDRIAYEAVPKHWYYGVPRVKSLIYMAIPEEGTRTGLLKTGGVDLTNIGRGSADDLKKTGLQVFKRDTSGVGAYRFEEQFKESYPGYGPNPLNDVRVRKALDWYAIDRKALVASFMKGFAVPTMNYPVSPADPSYEKLPVPEYDQAKVKALLVEAGYANGFELDFVIVPRPGIPEGLEIAEALAVWWERVGVKVNRLPMQYNAFRDKALAGGFSKPTAFGVWFLGNVPVATAVVGVRNNPGTPLGLNSDQELRDLAKAWTQVKSESEYLELGKKYQRRLYEVAGTTTLFDMGDVFGGSKSVPASWELGAQPFAFNLEKAAILR